MDQCVFVDFLACAEAQILTVAQDWFRRAFSFAQALFLTLAGLELVVSGYGAIRKQGPMGEVLKQVVQKVLVLGLALLLLQLADSWLGSSLLEFPVTTASGAASDVTGGVVIEESTLVIVVVKMGLQLFWGLFQASTPTLVGTIMNPGSLATALTLMTLALIIAGAFIRLATQLLTTIVECYIAVGAGAVMIGFLAFRGTAPLGEGYLRYIVYATVKLFFILCLVFFVIQLGEHAIKILDEARVTWDTLASGGQPGVLMAENSRMTVALSLGAVAMLLHGLMKLPDKLAQQMTSTLSINIKGVLEKL